MTTLCSQLPFLPLWVSTLRELDVTAPASQAILALWPEKLSLEPTRAVWPFLINVFIWFISKSEQGCALAVEQAICSGRSLDSWGDESEEKECGKVNLCELYGLYLQEAPTCLRFQARHGKSWVHSYQTGGTVGTNCPSLREEGSFAFTFKD